VVPELIITGVAWFFAWLFAVAGLHKLRSPGYYRALLGRWFPGAPGVRAGIYLVASAEFCVAAALIVPAWRDAALLAAAMLLLLYALAMGLQLASGRSNIKCGCAGPGSGLTISPPLVMRNLFCAAAALLALLPAQSVQPGVAGAVLSLCITAFLVAGYLTSEQLILNAQQLAGKA
jgi:hypothetical protein